MKLNLAELSTEVLSKTEEVLNQPPVAVGMAVGVQLSGPIIASMEAGEDPRGFFIETAANAMAMVALMDKTVNADG